MSDACMHKYHIVDVEVSKIEQNAMLSRSGK